MTAIQKTQFAALWDMDGTLIDAHELHYKAWKHALGNLVPHFDLELFALGFGSTNRAAIPIYLGYTPEEEQFHEISENKERFFRAHLAEGASLFPGVLKWLEWIKAQGIRQAIASSAPQENIDAVIDAFKLKDYFSLWLSGADLPSKPAPDVFLEAARRLGVKPQHSIVFEDARQGLAAGRAAGMATIGLQNPNKLLPEEADLILENYLGDPALILKPILERLKS